MRTHIYKLVIYPAIMGKLVTLVLSTFFLSAVKGAPACDNGWTNYKEEICVKSFDNVATYAEAEELCATHTNGHGSLVMVKDIEMQQFMVDFTEDIFDYTWLGGKYDEEASQILWQDGDDILYTNWQDGYPKNITNGDACIEMRPGETRVLDNLKGKWAHVTCKKRNLVMCQKPLTWTLQDAVAEIMRIKRQVAEDIEELEKVQGQLGETKNRLNETVGRLGETSDQLEETKVELEETKSKLDSTSTQLDEATRQLEDTTEDLAETREKLDQTSGQLEDTISQLGETKTKLDSTSADLEATKAQLAETTQDLAETKNKLDETKDELDETRGQLEGSLGNQTDISGQLGEIKSQLGDTQSQLTETRTQLSQTRTDLGVTNSHLTTTGNLLTETRTTLTTTVRSLTDTNTRLTTTSTQVTQINSGLTDVRSQLTTTKNQLTTATATITPVGSIYVQYYNQLAPQSLWPSMTWSDVSSTYAGMFFRAYGGASAGWGVTQAECSPRFLEMSYTYRTTGGWYPASMTFSSNGWTPYFMAGESNQLGSAVHEGMRINNQMCEVRPRNQAIRIWKRTR